MRSKALLLILLLAQATACQALVPESSPDVLIMAVHPGGAREWEHVMLENTGDRPTDLAGWTLGDGEGAWELPAGSIVDPGERVAVGVNTSAFQLLWGRSLDLVATRTGSFGLADKGDSLVLRDEGGRVVDQLVYGASDEMPPGWSGGPVPTPSSVPWGRLLARTTDVDTGTAGDWTGWTEPRCGWLEDPPGPTPVRANVSCFTTPEEGWEALSWAIGSARRDMEIALYDITSLDLVAAVVDRARWGVRARLLLEASPVGLDTDGRAWRDSLLATLAQEGVEVWLTVTNVKGEGHRPYRFHHEKYCIVDGSLVVVTTENWCAGSFPAEGGFADGSRGWGVMAESEELASGLLEVFEHDLRMSAHRFEAGEPSGTRLPTRSCPSHVPVMRAGECGILVGPEGWGPELGSLLSPLRSARSSIRVELAYLDVWWGWRVSPLVEALLQAAERGVVVRVVLDPGADGEGREALEELHKVASSRRLLSLRGVLASDLPGISRTHTKGAVVDGDTAVVGSLNWAWSSVARNREVVAVVRGAGVVAPLVAAFDADWGASAGRSAPSPPRELMLEATTLWDGGPFPRIMIEPLDTDGDEDRPVETGEGPTLGSVARTVAIVSLFITMWGLDRRYAYTTRATLWARRLVRRLSRRLEASSPPPSPEGGAPDAPRTTSPERDPVWGLRPGGSPPGPPQPRAPRVVVLEEVR